FMLDTGSRPNFIKEACVSKTLDIESTCVLKLNRINNSSVYTIGKIIKIILDIPVDFHVISNDFPIQPCRILGNDFFQ
ncbi:hypothetical protein EAI_03121, partial [Harpegnathos saltator]